MNDIDCSYDDLLCRSLSLFRQFRLYDDRIEEDNAFVFLREAEKVLRKHLLLPYGLENTFCCV